MKRKKRSAEALAEVEPGAVVDTRRVRGASCRLCDIHLKCQVKGSMGNIKAAAVLALLFGFGLVSSVHAHHGYAAYDLEKTVT